MGLLMDDKSFSHCLPLSWVYFQGLFVSISFLFIANNHLNPQLNCLKTTFSLIHLTKILFPGLAAPLFLATCSLGMPWLEALPGSWIKSMATFASRKWGKGRKLSRLTRDKQGKAICFLNCMLHEHQSS